MQLEISIESLLNKERIESDRIEFKEGWNPDDIYRSICAFANDFDNQGGGYILIGVEEENGMAVRPVLGVPENQIDKIQREMVGYDKKIMPAYSAKFAKEEVDGKTIIALWVPTGTQRPYKVPDNVTSKKDFEHKVRIRSKSSSVVATPEQEKELYSMVSNEPFDMLGNSRATLDDISEILLTEHLKETGSKLAGQVRSRGVREIFNEMDLFSGPDEIQRIRNVALMMFCEKPDKFFPYMEVDIVKFPQGSIKNPNSFIEVPPIKGPVTQIIKRTLEKIQDLAIENRIDKVSNQVETVTSTSYPINAIKEAVVNAFYHRDYTKYEPVTIEIEPECIRIINCPGIDRSVPDEAIKKGIRFRSRYYRNRRLGEFLHELDLCEGHCTGIPTMQEELEKNGSPAAFFETDPDRQSVCVTIPIHPRFLEIDATGKETGIETSIETGIETSIEISLTDTEKSFISLIQRNPSITISEIAEQKSMSRSGAQYVIDRLKEKEILGREGSTKSGKWIIKHRSIKN